MTQEKGIIAKFECTSCGATKISEQLIVQPKTGVKYNFSMPAACVCGHKRFNLINFVSAEAEISMIKDNP